MTLALLTSQTRKLDLDVPWWLGEVLADEVENRRFFVTKGLGAGGTFGGAMWHVLLCHINHRSQFSWAVAPTYQQVQDTLIPTFGEVLQSVFHFVESVDYDVITSGRPRIVLKRRGQEIHFKSANRADRFVGPSISHITMSEPGLYQPVAFEKASARLRCPRAKRLQQLWEGTPEGLGNRWEQEANFDEGEDSKRNCRRVIVPTRHNTYLRPSYIDNLRQTYSYDKAKLESYLEGRFVPFTKGTAYWEFFASRNVVLDVKASPFLPVIFTWDFGVSPLPWVGLQKQPHERRGRRFDRFVAIAEGSGNARGIMDACAEFIVAFPPAVFGQTPIVIDGGHDGYHGSHLAESCAYDQIKKVLQKYYTNVTLAADRGAPTIESSLNKVAALFSYELCVVAAWCRNLIKSLEQSSLKPGTWELLKPKGADPTHFADALRASLFRQTKGLDLHNPTHEKILGLNVTL